MNAKMKGTLFLFPAIGLIFLALFCCKKKESNPPATVQWQATINGKPMTGDTISAVYASVSTHLTISLFPSTIVMYPDILLTGRTIGNMLIDTGTYSLNGNGANFFSAEYDSSTTIIYYAADSGTGQLYISKFDTTAKLISGTFQFTAHNVTNPDLDSVVITNGSFTNVSLLVQ